MWGRSSPGPSDLPSDRISTAPSSEEQALRDLLAHDFVAEAYILAGVKSPLLRTDAEVPSPDGVSILRMHSMPPSTRQQIDPPSDKAFLLAHPQPAVWQSFTQYLLEASSEERFKATCEFLNEPKNLRFAAPIRDLAVSTVTQHVNWLTLGQQSAGSRGKQRLGVVQETRQAVARDQLLEILLGEVDVRNGHKYMDVLRRVRTELCSPFVFLPRQLRDLLLKLRQTLARCEQALGVKEEIRANSPWDEAEWVGKSIDRLEFESGQQREVLGELQAWMKGWGGDSSHLRPVRIGFLFDMSIGSATSLLLSRPLVSLCPCVACGRFSFIII
jgi:hypothetical protein